jgi:hypothetical protein
MHLSSASIADTFNAQGFVHLPGCFVGPRLLELQRVVARFHAAWCLAHADLLLAGAVNSAGLTGSRFLCEDDRRVLFEFLAQDTVRAVLGQVFANPPAFMNTQLFFNPCNPGQHNYWHRDVQYTGMSLDEQQQALTRLQVVHLRVALRPEPGLEFVPGTHRRWDTPDEFAVRMEQQGRQRWEALPEGVRVPLQEGDMLLFSANMLHRGLYGLDRQAFDMLFCDPLPELLAYVSQDCLPPAPMLASLPGAQMFELAGARQGAIE